MAGGRNYVQVATVGDIDIYRVTADPNGSLTGRIGSLAISDDVADPALWQNTDSGTTWQRIEASGVGAIDIVHLVGRYAIGSIMPVEDVAVAPEMATDGFFGNNMVSSDAANRYGNDIDGRYFEQDSNALNGGSAGWRGTFDYMAPQTLPFMSWKYNPVGPGTNIRCGSGITAGLNSINALSGADNPFFAHIGFQYSTSRADTNWMVTRKAANGAAGQVLVDTGVAVGFGTVRYFELDFLTSTSCQATIRSSDYDTIEYQATYSTDLPTPASTQLAWVHAQSNLTTASRQLRTYQAFGYQNAPRA